MTSPRQQSQYQVRFDWGLDGAASIAEGAHVLVWVDALSSDSAPDPSAIEGPVAVLGGSAGNCRATAAWILDRQIELGDRAVVAVVAAGESGRFAVEDLLGAGAVIDALADAGIDYISPEAAAAVGAFTGLRNATSHVLSASVSGQELIAREGRDAVDAAKAANSLPTVRILRE